MRKKIPVLTEEVFYELFGSYSASTIEVLNHKTGARRYFELKDAAAWILTCTQCFNTLEQPMMIVVWTKDWPDATKFQYLLQILKQTFKDYIPKWQIIFEPCDDFPTLILKWRHPSTVWEGHPVLGFMAETDFRDAFQQKLSFEIFIRCGHTLQQESLPTTRTSPLE